MKNPRKFIHKFYANMKCMAKKQCPPNWTNKTLPKKYIITKTSVNGSDHYWLVKQIDEHIGLGKTGDTLASIFIEI